VIQALDRAYRNERSPVLVIDNFLSDPEVLIDFAAAHAQFESVSNAFYPGVRAPIPPIYSLPHARS